MIDITIELGVVSSRFILIESSNEAKVSAMIFSLTETAKANDINTYDYLELLLTEIPKHQNDKILNFLDKLLPWLKYIQKKSPSRFKKT